MLLQYSIDGLEDVSIDGSDDDRRSLRGDTFEVWHSEVIGEGLEGFVGLYEAVVGKSEGAASKRLTDVFDTR